MDQTDRAGEALRKIRAERGLTLEEAAALCGVSKPMLSQIERGKSVPTITTLWKIATGLKVPLSAFLNQKRLCRRSVPWLHSRCWMNRDRWKPGRCSPSIR